MKGTSFSERVKGELASLEIPRGRELEVEILGFLKGKGSYNISSGRVRLSLNIIAARRLVSLMNAFSGSGSEYLGVFTRSLDSRKRVDIEVPDGTVMGWRDVMKSEKVFEVVGNDPVIVGAFLRGLFLASGSMTDPRRHYHLEVVTFDEEMLRKLRDLLEKIVGVKGNVVRLRYSNRLYYKRSRDILEMLHLMGASRAASELERVMREREAKGDANRSYNFISANAVRSGTSIARQIEAIRRIEEKMGLEALPEDLRRVAIARMENEDLSLRELGEMLNMSKMMVYSRLRKIIKIAEGLE